MASGAPQASLRACHPRVRPVSTASQCRRENRSLVIIPVRSSSSHPTVGLMLRRASTRKESTKDVWECR